MTISRRSFARSILAAVAGATLLRQAVAAPVKEQIARKRQGQWGWARLFDDDSSRKPYLDFYDKFCRAMFEKVDAEWRVIAGTA